MHLKLSSVIVPPFCPGGNGLNVVLRNTTLYYLFFLLTLDLFVRILVKTHWGREKNGHHFADDIFKYILINEKV